MLFFDSVCSVWTEFVMLCLDGVYSVVFGLRL